MGDIFYNTCPLAQTYRLWLWTEDGEWLRIYRGHRREDGLYLTLTPTSVIPSWVPEKRYRQREKESEFSGPSTVTQDILIHPWHSPWERIAHQRGE